MFVEHWAGKGHGKSDGYRIIYYRDKPTEDYLYS